MDISFVVVCVVIGFATLFLTLLFLFLLIAAAVLGIWTSVAFGLAASVLKGIANLLRGVWRFSRRNKGNGGGDGGSRRQAGRPQAKPNKPHVLPQPPVKHHLSIPPIPY